jgi:hypothetical protein
MELLPAAAGAAVTAADMAARCQQRLDEDPAIVTPAFYPFSEVLSALNRAQRMMVLLTLYLEATAPMVLASSAFYHMRSYFPDWMLPLRVTLNTGFRVRPARLAELDAVDAGWQVSAGAPARYAALGFDFLAVYQQSAGATLNMTYARSPDAMVSGTDTPEIPEDYHPALIDFAIPWLRVKEGAQEFQKAQPYLKRFLSEADRLGQYVRARNLAARYDNLPFELRRLDRSRFRGIRPDLPSTKGTMTDA